MEIMKDKILELVDKICSMESIGCRALNKSSEARKLMDIAKIPNDAIISEIPLDCDRQVEVLFYFPNDSHYYGLFAGIGCDGNFYFMLFETGVFRRCGNKIYFDFYDNDKELPINYFTDR